jgi:hypothetical protein
MFSPRPRGAGAVMSGRIEPRDSLDLFCTPPWATRALLHFLADRGLVNRRMYAWEPAAGLGHMARVLDERFHTVFTSDVHDYGFDLDFVGSFVGEGPDVVRDISPMLIDWIITNPPFNLACEFAERAIDLANTALLVRSVWAEGVDRYRRIFENYKPSYIAQFSERVPMVKGRWDPTATTATSYAWFIWVKEALNPKLDTKFVWIPPGSRERFTLPTDVRDFA